MTDRGAATKPLTLLLTALFACFGVTSAVAQSRTYTLDADFDLGTLQGVNHDVVHDQLQLNETSTPFPFVNIACSGRGTIVRIDVNTGQILGEYRTAPDGMGRNPSRTTVDKFGNVWVSNRDEAGFSGGRPKGSVTRVGLVIGGTRVNADGTPNPSGQYLKPPFQYSTCVDRDGDGLIKTSRGLGNILAWTNAGGADTNGGVSTADDECIINYTRVIGTNTRTVAIDANNDIWTGGSNSEHEKISGVAGQPIPGTQFNLGCGGYGGLVDGNNVLWSSRFNANLLRYDATSAAGGCLNTSHGDYGLGIDPTTGEIWHTNLDGNRVAKLAPDGTLLAAYQHGERYAQGVVVDGTGNVWVAHALSYPSRTVGHLRTDGTFVGNVQLPGGFGPTGVAVDANGKVWVANYNSNNAMRIDPAAGPIGGGGFPIGAVDMTVNLGADATPYNYSDMTGFVAIGSTAPQGTWTVVFDGGRIGIDWGKVSWNSEEPAGTSVGVEARAAETQPDLAGQTFVSVSNGVDFKGTGVLGRYIEIRATLSREQIGTATPVLYDLTVESNQPPVCSLAVPTIAELWPPDHKMVEVGIMGVTDPDGDPVTITITGITQDEPVNGLGDGNTSPDGSGVGTATAMLRAERTGKGEQAPGNGRVYEISFGASDGLGGECIGSVFVCVPHDQSAAPIETWNEDSRGLVHPGHRARCVDDGQSYDSTAGQRRHTPDPGIGAAKLGAGKFAVRAFPNPFNPSTTLEYTLPEASRASVAIYNALGRRVRALFDGEQTMGTHLLLWNGRDDADLLVPSGVYLFRVKAGEQIETGRLILMK